MKKTILTFLLCFSAAFAFAQNTQIRKGTVVEKTKLFSSTISLTEQGNACCCSNLTRYVIVDNLTSELFISYEPILDVIIGSKVDYVFYTKLKEMPYQGASIVVAN